MRLAYTRESLVATYRHYEQTIDGRVVVGADVIEETRNGKTRVIHEALVKEPLRAQSRWSAGALAGDVVYVNVNGEARLAHREIVKLRPLEPHAIYTDIETGAILRDDPLFFSARVFDVNPVTKLNDPSLRDRNNAASAVPDATYSNVPIPTLSGPFAQIVDTQEPFTSRADPAIDYNRGQPQFEEVNAYFQIDRTQRYLQTLGYIGARRLVDYSIPIDAHAANGTDNSFYLQQTPPGHGALFFGDGGTDDAEDPDIMLHEFFHAVQDWIAPGALAGPSNSEARALSEATADYWSFSSNYAGSVASGRDPYCIAEWDARCAGDDPSQLCGYSEGADCLRRVDSARTMRDYNNTNQSGSEYDNAAIWSSALREIFLKIGKPATDTLVIESLFAVPPLPSFKFVAQKMIEADVALNAGANASAICTAMTSRGILATSDCFSAPRGEWTVFTSLDTNVAIPDAGSPIESSIFINDSRAIDRVAVRVDIDHPVRGDLVITLVAPNGTEVPLKTSLDVDRTPGVHVTFGLDAPSASSLDVLHGLSALGQWKLRVQDMFATDVGTLRSWGLVIQFAGDAAATIRPTSSTRRIIPVVSHITGAGGITWTSDVFLANSRTSAVDATLIFTPSQHDGTIDFATLKFHVDAGQSVTIADVVAQMRMLGSGQLEIDGDVLSGSRIHGGGYEYVPSFPPLVSHTPVVLAGIRETASIRTNLGFAETSGHPATVLVVNFLGPGSTIFTGVKVPAFGHVQVPAHLGDLTAPLIAISEGDVIAYAAIVDNDRNDVSFEVARIADSGPEYAPVISGGGWRTEINLSSAPATLYFGSRQVTTSQTHFDDVVAEAFGTSGIGLLSIVGARGFGRIFHGAYAESLPVALPPPSGDLIGLENSPAFRTNIAVANIFTVRLDATLREFDVAGRILRERVIRVAPSEVAVLALTTNVARVRAEGGLLVYASVIDTTNGDPMLILPQ